MSKTLKSMKTKMEITLSTYTSPFPIEQSNLTFLLPVFFVGIDTPLQFVFFFFF